MLSVGVNIAKFSYFYRAPLVAAFESDNVISVCNFVSAQSVPPRQGRKLNVLGYSV